METSETCLWNETNKFIERWIRHGYSVLDDLQYSREDSRFRETTMYKNGVFLVFMANCRKDGRYESSNYMFLPEYYIQRLYGMMQIVAAAERQTRSLL